MTRSDDPDQIRREIERTQSHLSSDVNALTEKVSFCAAYGIEIDISTCGE